MIRGGPVESFDGMLETVTEFGTCLDCAKSFSRSVPIIQGRRWGVQERCDPCLAMAARRQTHEEAERELYARNEARRQAAESARQALGVPPLYAEASLSTWQLHGAPADQTRQQRMVSAGRRYLAEWPDVHHRLLVLRGGTGTGKGHWCWSIAKAVADEGASVRVVKLSDLIRELRRSWRDHSATETEEMVLARYRRLDLLVIDEVSRHAFYGEQIHQHLYDVIDHRSDNLRPTILTSNETAKDLADILRAALWSRIHGNGGVLEFGDGPDYRKRPKP